MITQTLLIALSCLLFSSLSSCSNLAALTKKSTTAKAKAEVKAKAKPAAKATTTVSKKSSILPGTASSALIAKSSSLAKDKHGMPTYKKASTRTRYVRTTAYSHMENEPGAPGRKNAAGGILQYGSVRSAAADWSVYPLGTKFRVKGQSHTYVIDDYGSALVGTNTIDIFKPSLKSMNYWGTRKTEITVIQWGSYERSLKLLQGRLAYSHCRKMYYGCKAKLSSNYANN